MAVQSFGPFDGAEEDWRSYTERLGQYFIANQITGEERKRAFLLSICGPQTYQLMRNILAPTAKPEDKNFEELVSLVEGHKNPKPSVIVRRYNFNSRTRKPEETVAEYVAELRKLAEYCAFGSDVEDMLRDRIVCGISDTRLQKRLLTEKDLTYKSALELAQSWEAAELNAKDIQKQPSGMNLYRVFQDNRSTTFYRCGGQHFPQNCKFKQVRCHACQKTGHLARVCRSRTEIRAESSLPHRRQYTPKKEFHKTHCVDSELEQQLEEEEEEWTYSLFRVKWRKQTNNCDCNCTWN